MTVPDDSVFHRTISSHVRHVGITSAFYISGIDYIFNTSTDPFAPCPGALQHLPPCPQKKFEGSTQGWSSRAGNLHFVTIRPECHIRRVDLYTGGGDWKGCCRGREDVDRVD